MQTHIKLCKSSKGSTSEKAGKTNYMYFQATHYIIHCKKGCIAFAHFLRNYPISFPHISWISFAHQIIAIIIINYDYWPWAMVFTGNRTGETDSSLQIITFPYCAMIYTHYNTIFVYSKPCFEISSVFTFKQETWLLNCQKPIVEITASFLITILFVNQKPWKVALFL